MRGLWIAGVLLPLLACSPSRITIGVILPESGEWSRYGRAIREGVQIAEETVRQHRALPAVLRLRYVDSASDPIQARAAFETLIQEGAVAIIGGTTTTEALALLPLADQTGRLLVSPSASATALAGRSPWFYRVYPSDRHEVMTAAKFLVEDLAARTVLILVENTDWSRGMGDDLAAELKRLGADRIPKAILPANPAAYQDVIAAALKPPPQALFIAAYADALREALAVLRSGPWNGPTVTSSAFNAPGMFQQVGALAEGMYFLRPPFEPENPNHPVAADFATRYRTRFGRDPGVFAAYGHDALWVLAEAIRSGGETPEGMRRGLRSVTNLPGATGTLSFMDSGEVLKFPRIYQVHDGRAVDYLDAMERYRQQLLRELRKTQKDLGP